MLIQAIEIQHFEIVETSEIPNINKLYYFLQTEECNNPEFIIKRKITGISIYSDNKIYYITSHEGFEQQLKDIFENEKIEKYGYDLAARLYFTKTNKYNNEKYCI